MKECPNKSRCILIQLYAMSKVIIHIHALELGLCEMDQDATEYWFASNLM
jgi:hypothetical protein